MATASPLAAASGPGVYIEATATVDGSNARDKASKSTSVRAIAAVVYACNVKKRNFQSAAEAFAKYFKNDFLNK